MINVMVIYFMGLFERIEGKKQTFSFKTIHQEWKEG